MFSKYRFLLLEGDIEIIEGCRKGLRKYQFMLYNRYGGKLMSVAMRYASGKEDAEEILQAGMIKIFKNIDSLKNLQGDSAYFWMKRIVINTALNYLRDTKKYRFLQAVENFNEIQYGYPDEDNLPENMEIISMNEILEIVNDLPQGYKTVFLLYSVEEYSHFEIAEMLGISVNTSKTQLLKARRAIIGQLKKKNKIYLKQIC